MNESPSYSIDEAIKDETSLFQSDQTHSVECIEKRGNDNDNDVVAYDACTSNVNTTTGYSSTYLALIPRGMELVVKEILLTHHDQHFQKGDNIDDGVISIEMIGDEETSSNIVILARKQLQQHGHDKDKSYNTNNNIESTCCTMSVGTVELSPTKHVSIGYHNTISNSIWTQTGQIQGMGWMKINMMMMIQSPLPQVKDRSTPLLSSSFNIANIRCIGPIVAFVELYETKNLHYQHNHETVHDAAQKIQDAINKDSMYETKFYTALQLWYDHVQKDWPGNSRVRQQCRNIDDVSVLLGGLKYRISCLRNDSKRYQYTRRELLQYMDCIIPKTKRYATYTVDLMNYDLEIVLLYRSNCFVIGFAIRPYQLLKARSFASGDIPADVALPILNHIPRVVRLRSSTAQVLLHLATIQVGDILLDPCVGIGTIPIEAHIQYPNRVFGIGGDLILNDQSLKSIAVEYIGKIHNTTVQQLQQCPSNNNDSATHKNKNNSTVPDLIGWDATNLPIRNESIDVIVSDLPFGQFCMSATKLGTFIPLLITEMARVLRRSTGRMVLLCGSYTAILQALKYCNECLTTNHEDLIWVLPCTAVFPVNIGGNLAWIVQVQRSIGIIKNLPDQRERIRKLVQKREHTVKMMQGSHASKHKHPQS